MCCKRLSLENWKKRKQLVILFLIYLEIPWRTLTKAQEHDVLHCNTWFPRTEIFFRRSWQWRGWHKRRFCHLRWLRASGRRGPSHWNGYFHCDGVNWWNCGRIGLTVLLRLVQSKIWRAVLFCCQAWVKNVEEEKKWSKKSSYYLTSHICLFWNPLYLLRFNLFYIW